MMTRWWPPSKYTAEASCEIMTAISHTTWKRKLRPSSSTWISLVNATRTPGFCTQICRRCELLLSKQYWLVKPLIDQHTAASLHGTWSCSLQMLPLWAVKAGGETLQLHPFQDPMSLAFFSFSKAYKKEQQKMMKYNRPELKKVLV